MSIAAKVAGRARWRRSNCAPTVASRRILTIGLGFSLLAPSTGCVVHQTTRISTAAVPSVPVNTDLELQCTTPRSVAVVSTKGDSSTIFDVVLLRGRVAQGTDTLFLASAVAGHVDHSQSGPYRRAGITLDSTCTVLRRGVDTPRTILGNAVIVIGVAAVALAIAVGVVLNSIFHNF
jgi:hypothetical protein